MPIPHSRAAYSQNERHQGRSSRILSRPLKTPPDNSGAAEQQQRGAVDDKVQPVWNVAEHFAEEWDQLDDREHGSPFEGAAHCSPFAMHEPWHERWRLTLLLLGAALLIAGWMTSSWLVVPGLALIVWDMFR